jgi:hypothetical protein
MSIAKVWYNLHMDYVLQRLRRLAAATGGEEDKDRYIRALERALGGEHLEPPSTLVYEPPGGVAPNLHYGLETVIHTLHGTQIRCEAEGETSFIRVCDEEGKEIVYWIVDEIEEAPGEIMSALVNYAAYGKPERCVYCGLTVYNARHLSGSIAPDWATSGGDFGCGDSPDTNEEGTGDHVPHLFQA